MSKIKKNRMIQNADNIDDSATFKPSEMADFLGINRSTCKGYLDNNSDIFPPKQKLANGYRLYGKGTIKALIIFKALRDRPSRLTTAEIKIVFKNINRDKLWAEFSMSNDKLHGSSQGVLP